MKNRIQLISDFILIRNRKARILNYSLLTLILLYTGILIYPGFLFANKMQYGNFTVHSNAPFAARMVHILDSAEMHLSASELYNDGLKQNIFICNNYSTFTFLAPLSRKAFACSYPLINNIFIARADIENNMAEKNDASDKYTRKLHELISHEVCHKLIADKLGFFKTRTLPEWKNEGYCEYIGYHGLKTPDEAINYFKNSRAEKRPGAAYRSYYYCVAYLLREEKMNFEELVQSELTFTQATEKILPHGEGKK